MASAAPVSCDDLKQFIRAVPDWPKPGILFYDITTLLKNGAAFARVIDLLADHYLQAGIKVDLVAGIEARGFIFGPALAYRLQAGFVPIRKPKKLPALTVSAKYALEYGTDTVEMHRDAVEPGQSVLIVDDLIATGGTAAAAAQLVESVGGRVAGLAFILELLFLPGRGKLAGYDVFSLLQYSA